MTTKTEEARQELFEFIDDHSVLDEEDKSLVFDILYNYDKNNRIRTWQMVFQILDPNTNNPIEINKANLADYNYEHASYYKISGIKDGKKVISKPTITDTGKSIGRANETTPVIQGLINLKNLYSKEIKEGYKFNEHELLKEDDIENLDDLLKLKHLSPTPWRIFGMAMDKLDLNGEKNWKNLNYPVFGQPKLDGVMCMIVYHPNLPLTEVVEKSVLYRDKPLMEVLDKKYPKGIRVDKFTRSREEILSHAHISLLWSLLADKYPGLYLVGELYKKGMPLQDINSTIGKVAENSEHDILDFWVFDTFYVGNQEKYKKRKARTDKISIELSAILEELKIQKKYPDLGLIKFLPTKKLENKTEVMNYYKEWTENKKTEGLVIRNLSSKYEYGINKEIRVTHTLKLKERFDDEWPVVDFTHGSKGKGVNSIVWICAVKSDLPLEKRKTFHVTYNTTDDIREKIYRLLSKDQKFFKAHIYGKDLTVNYSILSSDQVPLQPKGVRFRDTDIDILLQSRLNNVKGGKEELNSMLSRIIESTKTQPKNRESLAKLTSRWNVDSDKIVECYTTENLEELLKTHYISLDRDYREKKLNFAKYDLVIIGSYDDYEIDELSDQKIVTYYDLNILWNNKDPEYKALMKSKINSVLIYRAIPKIEETKNLVDFIEDLISANKKISVEIRDYSVDSIFSNLLHSVGDIIDYLNSNRSDLLFEDVMLSYNSIDNNYNFKNVEDIVFLFEGIKKLELVKHEPPQSVYPADYILFYETR
jgi:hypothetical protein